MTEDRTSSGAPEKSNAEAEAAAPGNPANKAFWMGIGIGSAAVVAALMYAKRPRGKPRT